MSTESMSEIHKVNKIKYEHICLLSSRILEKHIRIFEYDVFLEKRIWRIYHTRTKG